MAEFFHMGGYAFYVWASYGIAAVVLAANVVMPLQQHRKQLKRIAQRQKRARQHS